MAKNIEKLRKLTNEELVEKKNSATAEYNKLKFDLKSGNISAEAINRSRVLKLEIARISTVLNEFELVSENGTKE